MIVKGWVMFSCNKLSFLLRLRSITHCQNIFILPQVAKKMKTGYLEWCTVALYTVNNMQRVMCWYDMTSQYCANIFYSKVIKSLLWEYLSKLMEWKCFGDEYFEQASLLCPFERLTKQSGIESLKSFQKTKRAILMQKFLSMK